MKGWASLNGDEAIAATLPSTVLYECHTPAVRDAYICSFAEALGYRKATPKNWTPAALMWLNANAGDVVDHEDGTVSPVVYGVVNGYFACIHWDTLERVLSAQEQWWHDEQARRERMVKWGIPTTFWDRGNLH